MASITRSQRRDPEVRVVGGQNISSAVEAYGAAMFGVIVPSTFDGTTITFQVCDTIDGTYQPLEDATGAAVSVTTNLSSAFTIPDDIAPWPFFKLVCGTNQTGDTDFVVVTKG